MALPPKKYDVFLSFSGKDTGSSFTNHLDAALARKGVSTFTHNRLERGKEIQAGLFKAIEESRLSIIVFSENYASSKWCLDELVKIMETKRTLKQFVVPVFYDVNPSDVREQKGRFGERFAGLLSKVYSVRTFVGSFGGDLCFGAGLGLGEVWQLENPKESGDKEKVQVDSWKAALTEAANLAGWPLKNWPESEFIERIVNDCLWKLLFDHRCNSRQRPIPLGKFCSTKGQFSVPNPNANNRSTYTNEAPPKSLFRVPYLEQKTTIGSTSNGSQPSNISNADNGSTSSLNPYEALLRLSSRTLQLTSLNLEQKTTIGSTSNGSQPSNISNADNGSTSSLNRCKAPLRSSSRTLQLTSPNLEQKTTIGSTSNGSQPSNISNADNGSTSSLNPYEALLRSSSRTLQLTSLNLEQKTTIGSTSNGSQPSNISNADNGSTSSLNRCKAPLRSSSRTLQLTSPNLEQKTTIGSTSNGSQPSNISNADNGSTSSLNPYEALLRSSSRTLQLTSLNLEQKTTIGSTSNGSQPSNISNADNGSTSSLNRCKAPLRSSSRTLQLNSPNAASIWLSHPQASR